METKSIPMTNPPIVLFVKVGDRILEVVTTKRERVEIYELLTKYKTLEVIDKDLRGMILEDFTKPKK